MSSPTVPLTEIVRPHDPMQDCEVCGVTVDKRTDRHAMDRDGVVLCWSCADGIPRIDSLDDDDG